MTAGRFRRRRSGGQGLVEFAIGITMFLTILIGLIDLARAAFLFNGVSDAARELARVTSVHPGDPTLGSSPETTAAVSAERALVPGLVVNSYSLHRHRRRRRDRHLPAWQLGQGLGPDLLPADPAGPQLLWSIHLRHGQQREDPMTRGDPMEAMRARRRRSGGQILVVFVLSMMVIIGMVGLAIDGGGAYAQRRDQQSAADLAALAGANDYLLSNNSTQAIDRARTIAATNSFTNGAASTSVGVTIDTSNGVEVSVDDRFAASELVPRRPRDGDLERVRPRRSRWPGSRTPQPAPGRSSSRSPPSTTTGRRST